MRRLWFAPIALAALAALAMSASVQPAAAIEYPWCAQYTGDGDGGRNCGFVSYEQCMETARGMGSFCERNSFYTGPAERPVKRARKHKRHDD
jgi:hypothetical protein